LLASRPSRDILAGEIEIRTAHEIMAARTPQFAFLVDQLVAALRTIPPVLAGEVLGRRALPAANHARQTRFAVFSFHIGKYNGANIFLSVAEEVC
jgi:hypothetical protein